MSLLFKKGKVYSLYDLKRLSTKWFCHLKKVKPIQFHRVIFKLRKWQNFICTRKKIHSRTFFFFFFSVRIFFCVIQDERIKLASKIKPIKIKICRSSLKIFFTRNFFVRIIVSDCALCYKVLFNLILNTFLRNK
jgi:hypothetical protein